MKRAAGLVALSREHHAALVLAKRAQRGAAAEARAAAVFAAELAVIFARELEPHFRVEEEALLPALERAGQAAAVRRTLAEHAELRGLAAQCAAGETAGLARFGAALEAHVRFEEHELFPLAEAVLTPGELARCAG
jgi:hemerythrin-like domain-containing protein